MKSLLNSRMELLLQVAKDNGVAVVCDFGTEIRGVSPQIKIIDDDWADFANSDDNEPYKATTHNLKSRVFGERKQNNDWRSKHKRFSGFHETGM